MSSNRMTFSSADSKTYYDIPSNTIFNINGAGTATINGTIGKGARLNISGAGSVKINGTVSEGVIFDISGAATITFAKRPPESVIKNIKRAGACTVNIPGGLSKSRKASSSDDESDNSDNDDYDIDMSGGNIVFGGGAGSVIMGGMQIGGRGISTQNGIVTVTEHGNVTRYRGNTTSQINGRLFIDNREVTATDSRIIQPEQKAENKSSVTQKPAVAEKKLSPEETFLKNCSEYTQMYIKSFEGKKTHSAMVKDLGELSKEESALLEQFFDPITFELIEKPVVLNENIYDFSTLMTLEKNIDPLNNISFTPSNITPSRKTKEAFENTIKKIVENRNKVAQMDVESAKPAGAGAPGGPSF